MNKPIILYILTNTNIGKQEELTALNQEEESLRSIVKKNSYIEGVFLLNNESFEDILNVIASSLSDLII